jgi:signal recognition particle subunit SRP72
MSSFTAKLPKNYSPDVTPDPERWLPRKERSYYRGKRKDKKKEIGYY